MLNLIVSVNLQSIYTSGMIITTGLVLFSEPALPGACVCSCGFGWELLLHNSEQNFESNGQFSSERHSDNI